jgi:hypothetical protein
MAITPEDFYAKCQGTGVTIAECDTQVGILKLTKRFPAGDVGAYCQAEAEVDIIRSAPSTQAGSVWGSDSGSIGGHVGIKSGSMWLHKSGVGKRWLARLAKIKSLKEA